MVSAVSATVPGAGKACFFFTLAWSPYRVLLFTGLEKVEGGSLLLTQFWFMLVPFTGTVLVHGGSFYWPGTSKGDSFDWPGPVTWWCFLLAWSRYRVVLFTGLEQAVCFFYCAEAGTGCYLLLKASRYQLVIFTVWAILQGGNCY